MVSRYKLKIYDVTFVYWMEIIIKDDESGKIEKLIGKVIYRNKWIILEWRIEMIGEFNIIRWSRECMKKEMKF